MKIVIFGESKRLGVIVNGRIIDLEMGGRLLSTDGAGRGFFASLIDLIEAGEAGIDAANEVAEKLGQSDQRDLAHEMGSVRLHAPFPGRRMAAAGNNFAQHVADAFTNFGKPTTAEEVYAKSRQGVPGGFWSVAPPVGPGEDVPLPHGADGLFDYEGEVAVILAKGGKRLSADDWTQRIWGTTLLIDWSLRNHDLLSSQRPFYGHKIFDSGKTLGPWISVGEVDPAACQVTTLVNGELRQQFTTADMIFSFGELLEQMSGDLTLLPGDVLSSGTGPGTAADKTVPGPDKKLPLDLFLKVGDVVEVRAEGLGSLSAKVVESD